MFARHTQWAIFAALSVVAIAVASEQTAAQQTATPKQQAAAASSGFRWVNPLTAELPGVQHATFQSPSMNVDVGYCIYLPSAYHDPEHAERRFPVVYYLHGGRPGSETKSVSLATYLHQQIESGAVAPMIYVFVNGGPVSHYNLPDRQHAMGEDVFVKELIPHIDRTYRTIASRAGRGIEGFSQGGRGTTRIMFKYPELFSSAAPGGSGYATEQRISEQNGRESDQLVFIPGDNTWDLARQYAESDAAPPLRILIHVGTEDFNYDSNLQYMQHLESLGIPFQRVIVDGVPHSAQRIYAQRGHQIMQFHQQSFEAPTEAAR